MFEGRGEEENYPAILIYQTNTQYLHLNVIIPPSALSPDLSPHTSLVASEHSLFIAMHKNE
jgi:hypothetical protein